MKKRIAKAGKPVLEMRAFKRDLSKNVEDDFFLSTLLMETIAAMDAAGGAIYLRSSDEYFSFGQLKRKSLTKNYLKQIFNSIEVFTDQDLLLDTKTELVAVIQVMAGLEGLLYICNKQSEKIEEGFTDYDKALFTAMAATASLTIENQKIKTENNLLKKRIYDDNMPFIGNCSNISIVKEQINKIALYDSNFSVLIKGESGTGKELVAKGIQEKSKRSDKEMIILNCSSIPEQLLETELFGHVKGAFTGAVSEKKGKIAAANGGILFLDEIGEMPLALQAKMLRVLEDGSYNAVGSNKTQVSDFMLLSATNRDLELEVEKGNFRQDLYFRISTFQIMLEPLRKRMTDLDELSSFFINKLREKFPEKTTYGITVQAKNVLKAYSWPGNIRELKHCLESSFILSNGSMIDVEHLPERIFRESVTKQLTFDQVVPLEDAIGRYVRFAHEQNKRIAKDTLKKLNIDHRRLQRYLGNYYERRTRFLISEKIEIEVINFIDKELVDIKKDETKFTLFKRAIIEAVINIIDHSNDEEGYFDLVLSKRNHKLKINIIDYGKGFDIRKITYDKPEPENERGWGFFLMKKSADRVDVKSSDKGTSVVLEFKLGKNRRKIENRIS